MVDVDPIRSEDQTDAGVQICEDWLEGWEVGRESEGLEQIGSRLDLRRMPRQMCSRLGLQAMYDSMDYSLPLLAFI